MNGENGDITPAAASLFERESSKTRDDVNRRVDRLTGEVGYIRRDLLELTKSVETLIEEFAKKGRPNWYLIIGGVGTFLTLMIMASSVIIFVITSSLNPLNIRSEINSKIVGDLTTTVHQLEASSNSNSVADENSVTDRRQLNDRIRILEGALASEITDRKSSTAAFATNLKEIETQFCSSDIVRNLMHANELRIIAILWSKLYSGTYPTDNAYYPKVCQADHGS